MGGWRQADDHSAHMSSLRSRFQTAQKALSDWGINHLREGTRPGLWHEDPPSGPWHAFPAMSWRSIEITDPDAGHCCAAGRVLLSVQIFNGSFDEARAFISQSEDKSRTPRGPGRPSHMDLIYKDFDDVVAAGKLEETCQKQSEVLLKRFREIYPTREAPSLKTIRLELADRFKEAKANIDAGK
jgi:hypothetical protein